MQMMRKFSVYTRIALPPGQRSSSFPAPAHPLPHSLPNTEKAGFVCPWKAEQPLALSRPCPNWAPGPQTSQTLPGSARWWSRSGRASAWGCHLWCHRCEYSLVSPEKETKAGLTALQLFVLISFFYRFLLFICILMFFWYTVWVFTYV